MAQRHGKYTPGLNRLSMGKNRSLRYLDPACGSLGAQPAAKSPVLPGQSGVSFCKHKFAWAVWQMRTCRSETPPFCLRKNVLSLESPTGAFIASLRFANANLISSSKRLCFNFLLCISLLYLYFRFHIHHVLI